MPASMTSYLQKKLLDHSVGLAAFAMPATVYASLHTSSPGEAGSMAGEVTIAASGYARVAITAKLNAADAVTGVSSNNATILFGPALIDWGSISYVGINDASAAGNMLFYGALSIVQTTPIGESVQFSTGQFVITFA